METRRTEDPSNPFPQQYISLLCKPIVLPCRGKRDVERRLQKARNGGRLDKMLWFMVFSREILSPTLRYCRLSIGNRESDFDLKFLTRAIESFWNSLPWVYYSCCARNIRTLILMGKVPSSEWKPSFVKPRHNKISFPVELHPDLTCPPPIIFPP